MADGTTIYSFYSETTSAVEGSLFFNDRDEVCYSMKVGDPASGFYGYTADCVGSLSITNGIAIRNTTYVPSIIVNGSKALYVHKLLSKGGITCGVFTSAYNLADPITQIRCNGTPFTIENLLFNNDLNSLDADFLGGSASSPPPLYLDPLTLSTTLNLPLP